MKAATRICIVSIALLTLMFNRTGAQTSADNFKFASGIRDGQTSGFTFNLNTSGAAGLEFIVPGISISELILVLV
jgi:hypothetical protein